MYTRRLGSYTMRGVAHMNGLGNLLRKVVSDTELHGGQVE